MIRTALAACLLGLTLGQAAAAAPYSGRDCPMPRGVTPWHFQPDGCLILRHGQSGTLPRGATELDVWSLSGRVHLRQTRDRYQGDRSCPQWAYAGRRGYSAGWVTCNRDVFAYERPVVAYFWRG